MLFFEYKNTRRVKINFTANKYLFPHKMLHKIVTSDLRERKRRRVKWVNASQEMIWD